jgi:hypothetical protein
MSAKSTVQNVGTSLTLIATIERSGDPFTEASVEVKNTGGVAFNAFQVKRKSALMEDAYILADSALEFADENVIGCATPAGVTGDPTTLAPNASVILEIPFGPHSQAELWASVASGTTSARAAWEA